MQDRQSEFLPLDYKAMRRNRGECLLVSCAMMGCLMVVIVGILIALWFFFRPARPEVRPMEHQKPVRSVEVERQTRSVEVTVPVTRSAMPIESASPVASDSPTPARAETPAPEETPALQDFAPSISADGYTPGMTAVAPTKNLVMRGGRLVEVREAKTLQVDDHQWKAGQKVDLAQLRAALPTRRESQKNERDGSNRHTFPQAGGLEVQVWIRNGQAQKFALRGIP